MLHILASFAPYILGLAILLSSKYLLGIVTIKDMQVGIVIKKFASKNLSAGRLVALDGEAGIQADVLSPGWHFFFFPWQYSVEKEDVIEIPNGCLGQVVALDGATLKPNQILAQTVDCNNFQDARKFLTNGGQKGKQLGVLTSGVYRINTALFDVIEPDKNNNLRVLVIEPDHVGVVNVLDGEPLAQGEIAAEIVEGHNNFQDGQAFLDKGGQRGLQQQVLLPGSWNINPWFATVENEEMTEIPIGFVGVINSYCGKQHVDVSGTDFKHGELVDQGHKGIWEIPLTPGKYPLNRRTMMLELVPTTNTVLNWANNRTEAHNLDKNLSSIHVRSMDGFDFNMDVAQIIHISYKNAPRVISRVGSIQNLIDQVLQPTVANYFRNSMQSSNFLDFMKGRRERQEEARRFITDAVKDYDVEAVDTLIGDIAAPAALMQTLTDRKIAEEQRITFTTKKEAEETRQALEKQTAIANIQEQLVKAEQSVIIATKSAEATIEKTKGDAQSRILTGKAEAEAITAVGMAQAEVYEKNVKAMGQDGYTRVKLLEEIGKNGVKIVPNILVSGGGGVSSSEAMMAMLLGRMAEPGAQPLSETATHAASLTGATGGTIPLK